MTRVTGARLRAYNVGFGDCLLLSVRYDDLDPRHVLIDFGTTKLPSKAPSSRMHDIAENIAIETGGTLHAVVATHRHADHISGFGRADAGATIEALSPSLVVQSWTEHPDLDPAARAPAGPAVHSGNSLALGVTLHHMSAFAAGVASEGRRLQRSASFPKTVAARLEFLGETNLTNRPAVERLMRMGERHAYVSYGDDLDVSDVLPGVSVAVLGPPTLEQQPSIAGQARVDNQEFWHLAGAWGLAAAAGEAQIGDALFVDAMKIRVPQAARWLVPQIERAQAEEVLSLLRIMDDVLNNTSLILLVEIGGTTLLFPGDAQIENWRYALFDAPDAAAMRERLARTRLYKVGHHGSLNATPKTMWNGLLAAGASPGRLITVLSTLAGKHGDARRNTEVPRGDLVDALKLHSDFHTTQTSTKNKSPWLDVEVPLG